MGFGMGDGENKAIRENMASQEGRLIKSGMSPEKARRTAARVAKQVHANLRDGRDGGAPRK